MEGRNEAIYMITESQLKSIVIMTCQEFMAGMKAKDEEKTCNKNKAAKEIGVSRTTIYNMIQDGRLRATADGKRVLMSSIESYTSGKTGATDSVKTNRRGHKVYV